MEDADGADHGGAEEPKNTDDEQHDGTIEVKISGDETEEQSKIGEEEGAADEAASESGTESSRHVSDSDDNIPRRYRPQYRRTARRNIRDALIRSSDYDRELERGVEAVVDHSDALDWLLKQASNIGKRRRRVRERSRSVTGYVPHETAKPEMVEMTWRQYHPLIDMHGEVRSKEPQSTAAIDVLRENRKTGGGQSNFRRHFPRSLQEVATQEDAPSHADEDHVRPGLPARIRINSVPAKRILDSLCNDELSFSSRTGPLIIERPFKVLVWFDQAIRTRLEEMRALLRIREDASRLEPDLRVESALLDRKFPLDMMFYTGTDWGILTLEEIREATNDFACIVTFMDKFLKPFTIGNYPTEIPFVDLWHLFSSDCYIYAKDHTQKIWRVIQATGGRRYLSDPENRIRDWHTSYSDFVIDAYYLDYNGTDFVPVYDSFAMERVDTFVQLSTLPYLPLALAQAQGLVATDEVRDRGRTFLEYATPQHRLYEGLTLTRKASGDYLVRPLPDDVLSQRVFSERVSSQVVVDFERAFEANPDWRPGSSEVKLNKPSEAEVTDHLESVDNDAVWDMRFSEDLLEEQGKLWRSWEKGEGQPDGDNLLLLPDQVYAYVLRNRSWACLQIGTTGPVQGRLRRIQPRADSPWQDLEIPNDHKNIVQSLIATHFSTKDQNMQFDLVKDKGKGVVVLLHGVPGVGKTATAECVAESERKPLLPITCGDLGLKPKEVEATLQTAFQLAQAWDCVMLLDEADIFLAERDNTNIERNALVSVFLRVLEYYEVSHTSSHLAVH